MSGLLIGFWLLCAVTSAIVASSKRRDGLGHFFGGLLLGPLWLLMLVGMSPGGRPCPSCRERIDPMARVCPNCRSDLSSEITGIAGNPKFWDDPMSLPVVGFAILVALFLLVKCSMP